MSFSNSNSRHHVMSPLAQSIAKKALEQLSKVPQVITPLPENTLRTGRIAFTDIDKHKFSYQNFGLYSLSSDDISVPTIWKKETVRDPKTGTEMEWLVAYTTDDDNIMQDVLSSQTFQKTAAASEALRAVAEPKLPKNQPPIAPGVTNKNLTIDQGGQGGKATVTVDFNDPAKGEDFFKQIEDLTSEVGGTTTAPALPKEEKPEGVPPATEVPPAGKEPTPPTPTPAGAPVPAPMASTIKTLTHYGSKIVTIVAEQFEGYPERYYFVNEDGVKVALNLQGRIKVGSTIVRPDNHEKIRVIGYETVQTPTDDLSIIASLVGVSVDIADKVPPMGWTNKDSQNENDEAGNDPLPPNPALQENAPPTADTSNAPVYDSQTAQDTGGKQKFNMSVNPNDNSVTVKFEKPPALEAIDEAVQGQQPQLNPGVTPQAPQQGQPPAPPGQPQQKQDFNESESPIQF